MGPAKLRFDSVPEVPRHVIDVELLQSSLQELMTLYSISGVRGGGGCVCVCVCV